MKQIIRVITLTVLFGFTTSAFAQLDDLKKALGQIPGMGGDKDAKEMVESINWKELSGFLPESIDGLEKSKLDGGTFKTQNPTDPTGQYSYSSVSRKYSNEKKKLTITIMDSGYNQLLLSPFMLSYEFDGPDGSMKSITVKDQDAKLMTKMDDGVLEEVNLMIAVKGRIMVVFDGNSEVTEKEIMAEAKKIDYAKLESLIGETEKNIKEILDGKE